MVTVALFTVTLPLVTAMVSTIELSALFLTVMLPLVPFWTFSLKVATRLALNATPLAPSAGFKVEIVGAVASTVNVLVAEVAVAGVPALSVTLA